MGSRHIPPPKTHLQSLDFGFFKENPPKTLARVKKGSN